MNKTVNQKIIADDVLRYKKNKFASTFALLGLVFNCLYFMVLYCLSHATFYKLLLGGSVVLNLFVLLAVFLSSEGVKNYKKKFAILLIIVAAIQVARIFIYPVIVLKMDTGSDTFYKLTGGNYFGANLTTKSAATIMMVYLIASAACLVVAAVWGYIVAARLDNFQKKIDDGSISVEATLKAMDVEDEAAAKLQAEEPVTAKEEVQ